MPLTLKVASDWEALRLLAIGLNQVCANPNCGQMFVDATNAANALAPVPLPVSLQSICSKIPAIGTSAAPTASLPTAGIGTTPAPSPAPAKPWVYMNGALKHIIVPTLFTIIVGSLGWLISDKLSTITNTQKAFWERVGEMTKAEQETVKILTAVAATFQSHIKEDDAFAVDAKQKLADHETRVRNLEIMDALKKQTVRS